MDQAFREMRWGDRSGMIRYLRGSQPRALPVKLRSPLKCSRREPVETGTGLYASAASGSAGGLRTSVRANGKTTRAPRVMDMDWCRPSASNREAPVSKTGRYANSLQTGEISRLPSGDMHTNVRCCMTASMHRSPPGGKFASLPRTLSGNCSRACESAAHVEYSGVEKYVVIPKSVATGAINLVGAG